MISSVVMDFNSIKILMTLKKIVSLAQTFPLNSRCIYLTANLTPPFGYLKAIQISMTKVKLLIFLLKPLLPPVFSISLNGNSILPIAQVKVLDLILDSSLSLTPSVTSTFNI